VCELNESETNCAADCSGGDGGTGDSGGNPLGGVVVSPTDPGSIEDLLEDLGETDLNRVSQALRSVFVKRNFFVVSDLDSAGVLVERTRVVLEVSNVSGKNLKDIILIEPIPSSVLSDWTKLHSDYPYRVLDSIHGIEFLVPGLLVGQKIQLEYLIDGALSDAQVGQFKAPFSTSVTEASADEVSRVVCVQNSDCAGDNKCLANRCIKGVCFEIAFPENEPCDVGAVCKNRVCTQVTTPYAPEPGVDWIVVVSVVIILLTLVAIGAEYYKK